MHVTIDARRGALPPAVCGHVEARLERLERFVARPAEAQGLLDGGKYRHTAEVRVRFAAGSVQGPVSTTEMSTSIARHPARRAAARNIPETASSYRIASRVVPTRSRAAPRERLDRETSGLVRFGDRPPIACSSSPGWTAATWN